MTTDQKGAIAEAAIALAAMKLGVDVYRPLGEGGRYDLILDVGSRLLRVQCKWAASLKQVLVVRCYTFRRTQNRLEEDDLLRPRGGRDRRLLDGSRPLLPHSD